MFLRFCNAYAEFMGESELDTFITGFRLGAGAVKIYAQNCLQAPAE